MLSLRLSCSAERERFTETRREGKEKSEPKAKGGRGIGLGRGEMAQNKKGTKKKIMESETERQRDGEIEGKNASPDSQKDGRRRMSGCARGEPARERESAVVTNERKRDERKKPQIEKGTLSLSLSLALL